MIYTSILLNTSKETKTYFNISSIQKFGNSCQFWGFFCLLWLKKVPLQVFQKKIKPNYICILQGKRFSKIFLDISNLQKFGNFCQFYSFLSFFDYCGQNGFFYRFFKKIKNKKIEPNYIHLYTFLIYILHLYNNFFPKFAK